MGVSFGHYKMLAAAAASFVVPGMPMLAGLGLGPVSQAAIAGFASGAIASGGDFGSALQGAFKAAVFAGVGDLINDTGLFAGGTGKITDPFAQAALHGVAGCITSVAGGSKCGPGALAASVSKFATVSGFKFDGYAGAISSAIVGGTASVIGGGKFANGAVTAAAGYLFNELMHSTTCVQQGHCSKVYRDGTVCPAGKPCYDPNAGPAVQLTGKQGFELIGNIADAGTLTSLALFPPAAPVFGGIGFAADVGKFAITWDFEQLVIDVGIPGTIQGGFRPFRSQAQEFVKEAAGQTAKGAGSAAKEQRIKREGPP